MKKQNNLKARRLTKKRTKRNQRQKEVKKQSNQLDYLKRLSRLWHPDTPIAKKLAAHRRRMGLTRMGNVEAQNVVRR